MVVWDVLDAQLDDETKQAKDLSNLNSVFDVVKLALLEPDDKINHIPKINGTAYKGLIAISVGNTVVVFGEDGSSLLLQSTFNKCIDTLVWLPCGQFLLLADSNGYLHCIHITSKSIIFSRQIPVKVNEEEDGIFINGISYLEHNHNATILLLTKFGQIVIISDIDTSLLFSGTTSKDAAVLASIESQLSLKLEDVFDPLVTIYCSSFYTEVDFPGAKLWTATDEGIICWNSNISHKHQSNTFLMSPIINCSKLVVLQKGRYIAVLDNEYKISTVCTETGILLWDYPSEIINGYVILDFCELSCDNECSQLLTLVGSLDDVPSYFLCLMTFPDLFLKYELSVTKDTFLIKMAEGMESNFFIEGKRLSDDRVDNLNLKKIVDGVPETRLRKLLKSGKFCEAETFCETFNLDVSEVYKDNTKYLCDVINPWRSTNGILNTDASIPKFFEELLAILDKISDLVFVSSICSEAPMPDISYTKQLLSYGKQRIGEDIQMQSDIHLNHLMHSISENLYSMCTFEMVYADSNIHHWFEFCRKDILGIFFSHLEKGHLDIARTIWHRHQYKFGDKIDKTCVENILNLIPCNLPSSTVFNWLENHILQDILRLCPSCIEVIAYWIDRKLKTIEFHEKEMWPTTALTLAENILSMLNNVSSSYITGADIEVQMALYAAHEKAHSSSSSLYQLRVTALALQHLKVLFDNFHLRIKLNQYIQESKYCVVQVLLDMLVCGDEVASLFNNYIRDYMRQHNLECDQTLARYISDTLSTYGQAWWIWEQAPWENKLYAIIHVIVDTQIKSECILLCIQSASVPWNKGTIEICDIGIALNTPLKCQLESQSKLAKLKLVLRKYHIHKLDFANCKNCELILRSVSEKENHKSIIDAMIVVDAFPPLKKSDVYFFKLRYFMQLGKFDEAVHIFKTIEKDCEKIKVFNNYQNYVIQELTLPPITKKCKTKVNNYTNGILLLDPIINSSLEPDQLENLNIIRRLYSLQKFDIYLSIKHLEQKELAMKCLESFVCQIYRERCNRDKIDCGSLKKTLPTQAASICQTLNTTDNELNFMGHLNKIIRVSHLLGILREDLFLLLFKIVSSIGEYKIVEELTSLLTDEQKQYKHISVIYDIIEQNAEFWLSTNVEDNQWLNLMEFQLQKLYRVISSTLPLSSNEKLAQLTILSHWCFIGIELFNRCLLSNEYLESKINRVDQLYDHNFTAMFKDVSVPIEAGYVRTAISNILLCCCVQYRKNVTRLYFDNEDVNFSVNENVMNYVEELETHLENRNQNLIHISFSLTFSSHRLILFSNLKGISTILHKRILTKKQDMTYTLSLLTILKPRDSLKVLNEVIMKVCNDYSYLLTLANIGMDLCKLLKLKDVCVQFQDLFRRARWGLKFEIFGLSFISYLTEEQNTLKKGLEELVQHKDCDLQILADFSKDFAMNITDIYLFYLRALIHSWSPTFEDDSSNVIFTPSNELILKCQTIILKIDDKNRLKTMLYKELNNVCPYNYEVAEMLLCQLCVLEPIPSLMLQTGRDVICFLKTYKRHNPPSSFELEEILIMHPGRRELPQISKYRLPFHLLYSKKKNFQNKLFEHELNAMNYDQWVGISNLLMLKVDQIFFIAAKNTLSSLCKKKHNFTNRLWEIDNSNSSALQVIQTIIWKIRQPNLAMACSCLVVQDLPYSYNKVLAIQNCVELASYWIKHSSSSKATDVFKKFSAMHFKVAIEYSLHKYNLAYPELILLINDPEHLISKLYENPSIGSLTFLNTRSVPDINNCVTEICQIAGKEKVDVQFKLLQKWLALSTCMNDSMEETVSNFKLVLNSNLPNNSQSNEERLARTVYLLRDCPIYEAMQWLSLATSTQSTSSTNNRLYSLRCLLAIADEETIKEHTHRSMDEIRHMLQSVTYVSRLEEVGYAITVSQFDSMDKTALVEGLWHALKHLPKAVLLVIDICLNFKINSIYLWGALIDQIMRCVEDKSLDSLWLQRVLLQIKMLPHLWVLPQLATAWTRMLSGILSNVSTPLKNEDLESCIRAINLLTHHCPVEIDTQNLIEICLSLELPVLAAVVANSNNIRNNNIKDILSKFQKNSILTNYEALKRTLIIPKNLCMYFEELYNAD